MMNGFVPASNNKKTAAKLLGNQGAADGKLVTIISIVNLLATIGMLAILFVSFQRDKKNQSVAEINTQAPPPEAEAGKEKKEGEKGEKGEKNEGGAKEGDKKKSPDYGKMVTLEQFTVNLLTPGTLLPKYVRVNISIEVGSSDLEDEVNSKMPQIRNVIIDLFNSKRPTDLATVESRDFLKEEIQNALNSFLVSGKIKGVFFTSFSLSG